jgi:hypothetical protein
MFHNTRHRDKAGVSVKKHCAIKRWYILAVRFVLIVPLWTVMKAAGAVNDWAEDSIFWVRRKIKIPTK